MHICCAIKRLQLEYPDIYGCFKQCKLKPIKFGNGEWKKWLDKYDLCHGFSITGLTGFPCGEQENNSPVYVCKDHRIYLEKCQDKRSNSYTGVRKMIKRIREKTRRQERDHGRKSIRFADLEKQIADLNRKVDEKTHCIAGHEEKLNSMIEDHERMCKKVAALEEAKIKDNRTIHDLKERILQLTAFYN